MKQPARDRSARWSTPISPAARSTISSASPSRRSCGASCRARARPAACSRWRCASSATASSRSRSFKRARILVGRRDARDAARRRLRGAPRRRRRQEDPAPRHRHAARRPRRFKRALERAALHGRARRDEAGQAQPAAALHHLDPAAGGLAASSASRRRAPCRSRSGSTRASTSAARPSASSPICGPTACRWRREAIAAARRAIGTELRRRATVPGAPAHLQTKAKNAQEAHEAIRPTDLSARRRECAKYLDPDQARLYELIWRRTIASQMESAELERNFGDCRGLHLARDGALPDQLVEPRLVGSRYRATSRGRRAMSVGRIASWASCAFLALIW